MLGLKGQEVKIFEHQAEWEIAALETIRDLKEIFGDSAADIQHIGSTAVRLIKAKPIIDIAVGVKNLNNIDDAIAMLDNSGRYTKGHNRFSEDLLYFKKNKSGEIRTHQIHILEFDSLQWHNYIDFRDYLNAFPKIADEYEKLKIELAEKHFLNRSNYTDGKADFMKQHLPNARIYADLKKNLNIKMSD